ncbi:MAG: hypothetical protein D6679_14115 [Candidatus Hydrogenedentota bacterium]|nr:MAG: hypothetical protein D6679_14115 [Candidatus Hydrogenedentota bacterium]
MKYGGEPEEYDIRVEAENPVCGDRLVLFASRRNGRLSHFRWQAVGCPPVLAAAEAACVLLNEGGGESDAGREVGKKVSEEVLLHCLEGLPASSRHAVKLVLEGLNKLHEIAGYAREEDVTET